MRLAGLASVAIFGTILLLGGPTGAATGDALIVTGDGVNVRSGPSGDASVRMRVYHNQQVIELEREGSWVRAEIAGTDGQEGWIHSSLLAAPDASAPDQTPVRAPSEAAATDQVSREPTAPHMVEPAAGPGGDLGELAHFRETVSYLNGRAEEITGADLFAEVKPGPGGAMQVVATDAWSTLPPAGQQSYANTLLDRWAATKVSPGPVVLQIVGPSGEVVMEKTQP